MTPLKNARHDAPWYVYGLIDPRDGKAFYIGKGRGNRVNQHANDVARSRQQSNAGKCARIAEIIESGLAVVAKRLRWFVDEQAAIDYECALIKRLRANLTNVAAGGRAQSRPACRAGAVRRARRELARWQQMPASVLRDVVVRHLSLACAEHPEMLAAGVIVVADRAPEWIW